MQGGDVCSSESFNEDIAMFSKQVRIMAPTRGSVPAEIGDDLRSLSDGIGIWRVGGRNTYGPHVATK